MTQENNIQFSFLETLIFIESAVQSTDTRRSVNFMNFIIEHNIGGLWVKPQYKQERNDSLQKHDETMFCQSFDLNRSYS